MTFDPSYGLERQDTRTEEEKFLESLTPEQTRGLVERAIASKEELNAAKQFHDVDSKTFLKMYPAYVDSDHNAKLMKHNWTQAFGVEYPSLEQMEESFFALRASGVLTLNQKAVAKEDGAAIAQRADEIIAKRKAAEFNEADAYSMSLEELAARARGI